jgi:peptidyl-prolyl cis-trans isomerase A (cyclophilin A)
MKASLFAFAPLAVTIALGACSKTEEPQASSSAAVADPPASATAAATVATAAGGPAAAVASAPKASALHPDLLDPANAKEKAPDVFKARFTTTKGDFVIEAHRDWSPTGADRFYDLVKLGFYDDVRFFRVVDGFMVQFGISGDPAVNSKWMNANINDDPVKGSNKRGFVTFAQTNLPNTRSTQVFINYGDNARLDGMRFAPFGQVTQGMDVVDSLFKGYGESPDQSRVQSQGNAYLDTAFPKLDAIKHAEIVK